MKRKNVRFLQEAGRKILWGARGRCYKKRTLKPKTTWRKMKLVQSNPTQERRQRGFWHESSFAVSRNIQQDWNLDADFASKTLTCSFLSSVATISGAAYARMPHKTRPQQKQRKECYLQSFRPHIGRCLCGADKIWNCNDWDAAAKISSMGQVLEEWHCQCTKRDGTVHFAVDKISLALSIVYLTAWL